MSVRSDTWDFDALPPWMSLIEAWAEQVAEMNPFVKLFPFNYAEMGQELLTVGLDLAAHPCCAQVAWMDLAMQQLEVLIQTSRQAWGLDYKTVVEPDRGDKRFAAEEWSKNPSTGLLLGSALQERIAQAVRPVLGQLEQRIVQTVRQQMEQARQEGPQGDEQQQEGEEAAPSRLDSCVAGGGAGACAGGTATGADPAGAAS